MASRLRRYRRHQARSTRRGITSKMIMSSRLNLNEEKAADKKLTTVAQRKGVNRKAAS